MAPEERESRGQERDRRTAEDVSRADQRDTEDEERGDKRYLEDMVATDAERRVLLGVPSRPSLTRQFATGAVQGLIIAVIVIGLAFGINGLLGPSPLEDRVDQNTQEIKKLVRQELDEITRLNRRQIRTNQNIAVGIGVLICIELEQDPITISKVVDCVERTVRALEDRSLLRALHMLVREERREEARGSCDSDEASGGSGSGESQQQDGGQGDRPPPKKKPGPSPSPSPSPGPQICIGPLCIDDPRP